MTKNKEIKELPQSEDDLLKPWKVKPKQLIVITLLIIIILAQVIWALRSVTSYQVERRQIVSQETDISALTITQRDSFTLLQRIDGWSLGESTARDVLVARANLATRLNVLTGTGESTYLVTHKGYQEALENLDVVLLQLPDLSDEKRSEFRTENLKTLNTFETETRQLSTTFQNVLVDQLREALRVRVFAETIYVALLTLSLALFTGVVIWLGTDILRTYRKTSEKLQIESEILDINRNRLLLTMNLEKLSHAIVVKINQEDSTIQLHKQILFFVKELLPNDEVKFQGKNGEKSIFVIAGEDSIIEEDRQRVLSRAQELLDLLSKRDQAEASLNYQANHDFLTGLANRNYFSSRLNELVENSDPDTRLLVVALDIDRFGSINTALGFSAGDQLLQDIGTRLRKAISERDLVARVAADEFAIITFADTYEEARKKGEFIDELMHFTTDLGGTDSPVSASTGAVWVEDQSTSATEIVGQLSVALQVAKESPDESLIFFDAETHKKLATTWLDDLEVQKSFRHGDFVLHYQPVIELNSKKVTGFEALLRWNKPGQGLLYPNEFLESLNRAGLMNEVGRQILEEALLAWKRTLTKVPAAERPFISINVDPKQLSDPTFSEYLLSLARRIDVAHDFIVLEVTERDLLQGELAKSQLSDLRTAGIKIAIDDFGTGFSNFSQLRDLPVDIVKLDKSFCSSAEEKADVLGLISDMANMANRLNLKVVAEGIESESLKEKLREVGISYGQGYLFTQALPEEELIDWCTSFSKAR
jgi:diguanylate cyclase (GGDEF)-like protein